MGKKQYGGHVLPNGGVVWRRAASLPMPPITPRILIHHARAAGGLPGNHGRDGKHGTVARTTGVRAGAWDTPDTTHPTNFSMLSFVPNSNFGAAQAQAGSAMAAGRGKQQKPNRHASGATVTMNEGDLATS